MRILAIDPGPERSAWVIYDTCEKQIAKTESRGGENEVGYPTNSVMTMFIKYAIEELDVKKVIIENIQSYGMPVGKSVFDTCIWIGRFIQRVSEVTNDLYPKAVELLPRKDVKMYLCNSMRAKDSNVRQALIDRFPATGGGKTPQIGTKKQPGPLYRIKKDIWAALGVAVTYANQVEERR